MHHCVEEYAPKIFICVGISNRSEFSVAVFSQEEVELSEKILTINGHEKRIFHYARGNKKLAIIPHFSGRYGLNSNVALQQAGEFVCSLF